MARARRKSVYYAHALCLYGHPQERLELAIIRRAFPGCKVINPAAYENNPGKRADTLGFCFRLVDKCDGLVFTRLFGKVTAGVGKEVKHALSRGEAVYELIESKSAWEFIGRKRAVKFISRRATTNLYDRFRANGY